MPFAMRKGAPAYRLKMKIINSLHKKLLLALPSGAEAHRHFLGIQKLDRELGMLVGSKHVKPISQADAAFAKALISIASSYGFSSIGGLAGGSFHFYRVDDDLHQRVRIYPDCWPRGVLMFLDIGPQNSGVRTENGIEYKMNTRDWEETMTPKSEIIDKFIEYLEHAQQYREHQAADRAKRNGQGR